MYTAFSNTLLIRWQAGPISGHSNERSKITVLIGGIPFFLVTHVALNAGFR